MYPSGIHVKVTYTEPNFSVLIFRFSFILPEIEQTEACLFLFN